MRSSLAAALVIAAVAGTAASAPLTRSAILLDTTVAQARKEAAAATADQKRLEAAAGRAQDEVRKIALQRLAAVQAIQAAEASISAADAETRAIEARLAEQRLRLARERAPAESLVGALALMTRRPPLLLLADTDSPEQLVALQLVLRSALPAIRAKTAALSAELNKTEKLRVEHLASRSESQGARRELERRAAQLAELESRAESLAQRRSGAALAVGDLAIARQEATGGLERESRSDRSALAMAAELAASGPAPNRPGSESRPGAISLPDYRLPANAPVVEGFGSVDDSGIRSRSITLATTRGAPVFAPAAGTILFSGPFKSFDGVIIIDHGSGWRSVLINAGSSVPRGSRVNEGSRLGSALGPIEVQLLYKGEPVSAALIAGSSGLLSNARKGG